MNFSKVTAAATAYFLLFFLTVQAGQPQLSNDKILLRSGTLNTQKNFTAENTTPVSNTEIVQGRCYRLIQFEQMPDENLKQTLMSKGIRLLNYIPYNSWVASLPANFQWTELPAEKIRTVLLLDKSMKMSKELNEKNYPAHALLLAGQIDLLLQFHSDLNLEYVLDALRQNSAAVVSYAADLQQVHIRISLNKIEDMASLACVKYVQCVAPASEPEDTRGRSLHRSNVINSDFSQARHYNGAGVTISLADDGLVGPHIDFQGRITNIPTSSSGSHGDMTAGIAVGAGNKNPAIRGMAEGAQILIHAISGYTHITDALNFYANNNAVITSTSYSQGCNDYDLFSSGGDQLVHQNPQFSLVFSAGNRGQNDCGYGAGAPYGTITGGYKQGKNVIAVGNLDAYEVLDPSSSRGPAADGRVKPDICSNGRNQLSTSANNNYQTGGGTSAACPGIAGITAQLYQAYKEFNGGREPASPLIKASLLNSAEDIGLPGPDFTYGWGRVNAFRALTTLEDRRYILDSVAQGSTKTHLIPVSSGTKQLRLMLYWLDAEGDPLGSIALVNDLDLILTDPNSISFNPWILDPSPNVPSLTTPAIRGIDRLNNAEQITVDDPTPGSYVISVNGTSVPAGVQQYYIVWEYRTEEIMLTYPNGGEGFVPAEVEMLRWDAFGNTSTFALDYSLDDGLTWNVINSAVAANVRQYEWTIPQALSDQVKVRITRGLATDICDANLAISPVPANITVDFACADSLQISWNAVPGITGYEVSRLGTQYMDSTASVNVNYARLGIPSTASSWFSVRTVGPNGGKGRRAIAVQKNPGIVNCTLSNDMTMVNIVNPQPGNLFDCQNLSAVPILVNLRNNGLVDASGFDISYSINGGTPVIETYNDTLAHGAYLPFVFSTPADLSLPGTYQIYVQVSYSPDQNLSNDAQFINVVTSNRTMLPFTEDFQSTTFPPLGWSVIPSGTTYQWANKTGIIGSTGLVTTAAWFDNFSYNNGGALDYLTMQLTDLNGLTAPFMTFDVAYAVYGTSEDGLKVEISSDCGVTYQPTGYLKFGSDLGSTLPSNSDWEPTLASDWRTDTIDLTPYINNNVIIRFVNINDYGNNLYVDNINLRDNSAVNISSNAAPLKVNVYPNPSAGFFFLRLDQLQQTNLSMEVFDMQGRSVWSAQQRNVNGHFSTSINLKEQPSGVYFLRVVSGETVNTIRLIRN